MVSDIRIKNVRISFEKDSNRVPLKFGHEITTEFTMCRAHITVQSENGLQAEGIGETPVAVAWTWPSDLSFSYRENRMIEFCNLLCKEWQTIDYSGHPMEIGYRFIEENLKQLLTKFNEGVSEEMPYLSALVCNSLFDIALYDAFANLHNIKVFDCFNSKYMNHDLAWYYSDEFKKLFEGKYPENFMVNRDEVPKELVVWHLVGGTDPIDESELTGKEPNDGIPVLLKDWINEDGLKCLKIKLRGNDEPWDYERIVKVGNLALEMGVEHLTADFNCTVTEPSYVCRILDKLKVEHEQIFNIILYIEQPFPYDMEKYRIDVHEVSQRKLLLMDESAHDWHYLELGMNLGWTGVALKTCKTLTGAMLMLCFARVHNLKIMVQDLTNPKLAIIPHVLLAANVGTIMGVECNSMQFCPKASDEEAFIHPLLYKRNDGIVKFDTLGKVGFGYRTAEMHKKGEY